MAYNQETSLSILKARMDRAGVTCPPALEAYWTQRNQAAAAELTHKGIELADTVEDNMLVADVAAETLLNRDKQTGRPEWIRLAIRERWLQERDGSAN